jgi:hypothetical protein
MIGSGTYRIAPGGGIRVTDAGYVHIEGCTLRTVRLRKPVFSLAQKEASRAIIRCLEGAQARIVAKRISPRVTSGYLLPPVMPLRGGFLHRMHLKLHHASNVEGSMRRNPHEI